MTSNALTLIQRYGDGPHITALKAYREMTGCSLREAVERLSTVEPPIPLEHLMAGADRTRAEALARQDGQRKLEEEHARFRDALRQISTSGHASQAARVAARVLEGWPLDLAFVPAHQNQPFGYEAFAYVELDEVPESYREALGAWLVGRKLPPRTEVSAYADDFDLWVRSVLAAR